MSGSAGLPAAPLRLRAVTLARWPGAESEREVALRGSRVQWYRPSGP